MLLKKYSIFLLSFLIILSSIFLYPLKSNAEVVCTNWDNAISKSSELHEWYREKRNDIGIFYDFEWDKNKKIIKIKRNEDNYPIVRFSLFNKKDITQGTIIKSYNNIDLSKKLDSEIKKIHKQTKRVVIEIIGGRTVNIGSKPYKFNNIKMNTFGLQTIQNIEATKGIVEISFRSIFTNERPDLLKILKDSDLYIGNDYKNLCNKTIDENDFPIESFNFDEFKYDEDLRRGLDDKTIINNPIIALSIDKEILRLFRYEDGVSFYRQDFKFEKFPFDKQTIKIKINSNESSYSDPTLNINNDGIVTTFITPEKGAFLNLDSLKKINYLKEWEIISTDIKSHENIVEDYYDPYSRRIFADHMNTLIIEIEIKRNYEQYIFKVIIPVFLILSLAWFVLWMPTKEFETRLSTSMVALLSLIAYNFVFADDVPKLNYLTALDEFILLSYIFCCIPTFMSIWFSRFISTNQKKATSVNKKIRVWGIVLYFAFSLWIFFPK